ncbi:helix-turn-helix domain-containing protein [Pseudonocardia acaciae]|uniref:helix-turn-helix domain-containing protein n=1 Tax=Pseudonocardia acaciae TaxID=551276 RepID=UPI000491B7CB|nr:helix-turn-helix transcriptional regulator [Pseudonocardia acaciae]
MALEPGQAARLAHTLRELREAHWSGVKLKQTDLATALSKESHVASATISSWESTNNPKSPPAARLRAYARFFATRRSLDGGPHLIPDAELTDDERKELHALEERLLGLLRGKSESRSRTFAFDDGPVTVICPALPEEAQSRLADVTDPNFSKLQQYADLDALIEMFGHLRMSNPTLDIFHRLASDAVADDLSTHVILLGGIAWNQITRRFQEAIGQVPIAQVADPDKVPSGEIFVVDGSERFYPIWEREEGSPDDLIEDVGFLARLPNPFNLKRTLTICNGVYSRGVLGAVRCLTDARVRDANEAYLADRFPSGRFAVLIRVPVVSNETLSPDLQNPQARLYEWPSDERRT